MDTLTPANIGYHLPLAGFRRVLAALADVIIVRPWREDTELIDLPSTRLDAGLPVSPPPG